MCYTETVGHLVSRNGGGEFSNPTKIRHSYTTRVSTRLRLRIKHLSCLVFMVHGGRLLEQTVLFPLAYSALTMCLKVRVDTSVCVKKHTRKPFLFLSPLRISKVQVRKQNQLKFTYVMHIEIFIHWCVQHMIELLIQY